MPVLAGRRLVVARPSRGSPRAFRRCVGISQSLWLAVRGHRSPDRDFVGKFSSDLLDGRADLVGDAVVTKLGGPILARLIVVSNRVAIPNRDGNHQAGGLAVAVRSLLKRHEGLWFGWSGTVSDRKSTRLNSTPLPCTTLFRSPQTYSMAGLILSAMRLSRSWEDRYWRG